MHMGDTRQKEIIEIALLRVMFCEWLPNASVILFASNVLDLHAQIPSQTMMCATCDSNATP